MKLLAELTGLGNRMMERFPYLNCGGCAVYASAIVQALHTRGIEAYARVCNTTATKYWGNARTVEYAKQHNKGLSNSTDWNMAGVRFDHVVVEFVYEGKSYLYDSDWLINAGPTFDKMDVMEGRLTKEEIIAIANDDEGDWNKMFERRFVGKVKKYVKLEMNIPVIH